MLHQIVNFAVGADVIADEPEQARRGLLRRADLSFWIPDQEDGIDIEGGFSSKQREACHLLG